MPDTMPDTMRYPALAPTPRAPSGDGVVAKHLSSGLPTEAQDTAIGEADLRRQLDLIRGKKDAADAREAREGRIIQDIVENGIDKIFGSRAITTTSRTGKTDAKCQVGAESVCMGRACDPDMTCPWA